ncbi:TPA: Y-family DNA polymerase [Pseudomonas aeruginosa]
MNGRKAFILTDCDNFYVNVEKLWRPDLLNRPVVVAGSNDGCIISRSNEAKALGVKMGEPAHQVRDLYWRDGIVICSANFALYGDMSSRVMRTLASVVPKQVVYSVDESFAFCDGMSDEQLHSMAVEARSRVLRWCGLGTGAGIGPTLTLAKLASYAAKRVTKTGLCNLMSPEDRLCMLEIAPVSEVWGIGPAVTRKLEALGVKTAAEFARLPRHVLEREFPVPVLRTQMELNGICAITLDEPGVPRQMINVSRSFGSPVTSVADLANALVAFVSSAAAKLRRQQSTSSFMRVYAQSSQFSKRAAPYAKTVTVKFRYPLDDTRMLAALVSEAAASVFRPGVEFSKAGVCLMGIAPKESMSQGELFGPSSADSSRVMEAVDGINGKFGRGTIAVASEFAGKSWRSRSSDASPAFSTKLAELKTVY